MLEWMADVCKAPSGQQSCNKASELSQPCSRVQDLQSDILTWSSKDVQLLEGWASSTLTKLTVAAAKWPSGLAPVEGSLVLATTVHGK